MFGNMIANLEDLNPEEKDRYGALYCGLCHTMKDTFGQASRMALSYDMTFFIMLLGSLYEPAERTTESSCIVHPLKKKTVTVHEYTAYAADVAVMLAWHKCLDDWHDDKKVSSKCLAAVLKGAYRQAAARHPRQSAAIENALAAIGRIEQANDASPDAAANMFGMLFGELFVTRDDCFRDALFGIGYNLGRFIYLVDAAIDLEEDRESGSYNPFVASGADVGQIPMMLSVVIGGATQAFERLPLIQDEHLLRSVLYAGVWQQYNAHVAESDESGEPLTAFRSSCSDSASIPLTQPALPGSPNTQKVPV